jgi:Ni,Fe-hydrogenase III large subunit
MNNIVLRNNQRIPISSIPILDYDDFMGINVFTLMKEGHNHCVNFYGIPTSGKIRLICCIANDDEKTIMVNSSIVGLEKSLSSFTAHNLIFEKFEREIHENFGINYTDHPWLKPVRYPFDRAAKNNTIGNYPFYRIESEELHEVGVGPIHAGIIEPGHFRFICNGEQILHLEIQLGYQHRGVEKLFLEKKKLLQLATLAESIAGDTTVGHSVAFVNLWESLCNYIPDKTLRYSRTLALEHERIAIHTGDLSAISTDIAYQLGSSVFGRLRTPIINYFQIWCGNRLAKGLIRPGKTNFSFTRDLADKWLQTMDDFLPDFVEMANQLFDLPSALARLEKTGVVSKEVAASIGTVGMTARSSGINRDIRFSHPHDLYQEIKHEPVILESGDVIARAKIRYNEVLQSVNFIKSILPDLPPAATNPTEISSPVPDSFVISLVESWRGEICHCAVTGSRGELLHYKIKDPSLHNWLALALAVRNNEISDFPISNKSFDLSYCGHDL